MLRWKTNSVKRAATFQWKDIDAFIGLIHLKEHKSKHCSLTAAQDLPMKDSFILNI